MTSFIYSPEQLSEPSIL